MFLSQKDKNYGGICNRFMKKCFFVKKSRLMALPL